MEEVSADEAKTHLSKLVALGRENGLTSYDAAYLELAIRPGLPTVTLDSKRLEAAKRVKVPIPDVYLACACMKQADPPKILRCGRDDSGTIRPKLQTAPEPGSYKRPELL